MAANYYSNKYMLQQDKQEDNWNFTRQNTHVLVFNDKREHFKSHEDMELYTISGQGHQCLPHAAG